MLSELLGTINKQFTSKSFWLGSMFPLILFLSANALIAYPHYEWFAKFTSVAETWDEKAFKYSTLVAALLAVAFVLSMLNSVLLRMLEGKTGPINWLEAVLSPAQTRRLAEIDRKYKAATNDREDVSKETKDWLETLDKATTTGKDCTELNDDEAQRWRKSESGTAIERIRGLQARRRFIPAQHLGDTVGKLSIELKVHTAERGVLHDALDDLKAAIQYSMDRYESESRRLLSLRNFNFPGVRPLAVDQPEGPVAIDVVAPTLMGNIGLTMNVYTLVRYGMDLDIFWTRLQNSLQKDAKEYYGVIQDTKVLLDATVMLFWLSAVFTLFWTPFLLWGVPSATTGQFVAAAGGGTATAMAFYALSCENYRVFAEVMRSAVDLFRFQLLQSFHLALPSETADEKRLWNLLAKGMGFYDPVEFRYKHPGGQP